ncbi:MAG: TonB family protein [Candidatus Zixiibacteriota bacterium]
MASNVYVTRWSPIGAIELKRTYQKNMRNAMLLVFAAFAAVFLVIGLVRSMMSSEAANAPTLIIRDLSELGPPPSLASRQVQVKVSQEIAAPKFTLPEAVPDEEVTEDFVVVSQEELADITSPVLTEGEGSGANIQVDIPMEEYIPSPDEFIAVEERPVPIQQAQPKFPEIARKAGIEGSVWVKVLVDRNGNVKDAMIAKESGTNAGFEEAALEAAKATKWKPAMQNKQPVALWVTYEIKFQLKAASQ